MTDVAVIVACVFAFIKGRPAERYGAVLYFASSAGTFIIELVIGQDIPVIPVLLLDTAVAVGFLLLAIRYNNPWLGAAMMVKGLQLALHATHLTDFADANLGGANLYYLSLDAVSLIISVIIFGATLSGIRARRRAVARSETAADPSPIVLGAPTPPAV